MSLMPVRPLVEPAVLERAREALLRKLGSITQSDPERLRIHEALHWIDAGVYGGCSVCGCALPTTQILSSPADKVCQSCRAVSHAHARQD